MGLDLLFWLFWAENLGYSSHSRNGAATKIKRIANRVADGQQK